MRTAFVDFGVRWNTFANEPSTQSPGHVVVQIGLTNCLWSFSTNKRMEMNNVSYHGPMLSAFHRYVLFL